MLEAYLIRHCAPTLASLKTAGLFRCAFEAKEELERQLSLWNTALERKGVFLRVLRREEKAALVYVYRRSNLQRDLHAPGVERFLQRCGYTPADVEGTLCQLEQRLQTMDGFPHEIGVFLGYPLGDVIGFIRNKGKNSKYTGDWKVYCNLCEAVRMFAKYKKCKRVYAALWEQGRSILQLTVAA